MLRPMLSAGGVLLVCLLTANSVDAAPLSRSVVDRYTAGPAKIAKVMRRLKALSSHGVRMRRARAGLLFDFTPRLHRATVPRTDDDSDAIQNDGPVTLFDTEDRAAAGLQPIGIVAESTTRRCAPPAFSPRSPRGPPPNAPTRTV